MQYKLCLERGLEDVTLITWHLEGFNSISHLKPVKVPTVNFVFIVQCHQQRDTPVAKVINVGQDQAQQSPGILQYTTISYLSVQQSKLSPPRCCG